MPTFADHLQEGLTIYGSVPPASHLYSCQFCLGPKSATGFTFCLGCDRLLNSGTVPPELHGAVVPMTTALQPSTWYNRLQMYKTTVKEYGWLLAALVHYYLPQHLNELTLLLGGAPSFVTVVPSKKPWITFESQTLRRVLSVACSGRLDVIQTLDFAVGATLARQQYKPNLFTQTRALTGERIILIEDTWTSGATAVSAAGALLREGAAAVAILPIARQIALDFHGEDHPHIESSRQAYDIAHWPRS